MKPNPADIARDPMCYPQLESYREIFEPELTFAQRLKGHIDFCLREDEIEESEDPNNIIIY